MIWVIWYELVWDDEVRRGEVRMRWLERGGGVRRDEMRMENHENSFVF